MTMIRYNPFSTDSFPANFKSLEDGFARVFSDTATRPWTPAVDVFETENEMVLKADLPEVDPAQVDVQVENGTLTLKGERRFEKKDTTKGYHRVERGYGTFARAFTLPDTVDASGVAADYKAGVLTITLPKKEIAKPRSIKVSVKQ